MEGAQIMALFTGLIVKITENKGIKIGTSVILFGRPLMVVGFRGSKLVLATDNPKKWEETQVLICNISQLGYAYEIGKLEGLIDMEELA